MLYNEKILKVIKDNNLNQEECMMILFAAENNFKADTVINYFQVQNINALLDLNLCEVIIKDNIHYLKLSEESLYSETLVNLVKEYEKIKKRMNHKDVLNWIDEWLLLFPKGLHHKIGYDIHGNKAACLNRFNVFLTKVNVGATKEEIFNATILYLNEQYKKNWEYTKKNVKFINDNDGSLLDMYIDRIKSNDYEKEDLINHNFNEPKPTNKKYI